MLKKLSWMDFEENKIVVTWTRCTGCLEVDLHASERRVWKSGPNTKDEKFRTLSKIDTGATGKSRNFTYSQLEISAEEEFANLASSKVLGSGNKTNPSYLWFGQARSFGGRLCIVVVGVNGRLIIVTFAQHTATTERIIYERHHHV